MASDPYLAVTLDAKRRIARAADAIQANAAVFTLGYLNLLEHVWERKDARVSALVLSACFGPDPRVPATLVEFGFVVAAGGAWDLNQADTDRLLLTHKQRVAAGKARAATATRAEDGRVQRATSGQPAGYQRSASEPPAASQLLHPAPSTQQKEETTLPAGADLFPSAPPAPSFSDRDLQALWNTHAARAGWARWDAMPEARRRPALARLREHPERGWWETVLLRAEKSAFLRGENDRGFRFNPDTLLRAGRAESVLEGKYDGGHSGKVVTTTPERKVQVL